MKISIIIPVYNGEKYLERCLDSVLALKCIDWECILIDDGSTDKSWDIIQKYVRISNGFIARRKENGGVSSARNAGLEICTGDRVMFVDSDDYLFPEADQLLYQSAMQNADCDMVIFEWSNVFPDGTEEKVKLPNTDFGNSDEWIKKMLLLSFYMNTCWARLFNYSIIKDNNLRFDESMRVAEDGYFICEYLKYCNTICAGGGQLYAYYQSQNSAIKKFSRDDIWDEFRTYSKKRELAEIRNIFLSQQEEAEMNGHFLKIIHRCAGCCAGQCSILEFRHIMARFFENAAKPEIINNCYPDSKYMLVKFMLRHKLFGLYWCVIILHKQTKWILKFVGRNAVI